MVVPVIHHGEMIADLERLRMYKTAIEAAVRPHDAVVDVGSGLGPLCIFASRQTDGRVTAIEYLEDVAEMSKAMLQPRIEVIQGRSYDVTFDEPPDVVVTETIGPVGPEENIVEIMFDLKTRYPAIRTLIPSTLRLYAQAAHSINAANAFARVQAQFRSAEAVGLAFGPIEEQLTTEYCRAVYQDDCRDARAVGDRFEIAAYVLGESPSSAFNQKLTFSDSDNWNAVLLTFEACLHEGIMMSNSYDQANTHWYQSYICRPPNSNILRLSYDDAALSFGVDWMEGLK